MATASVEAAARTGWGLSISSLRSQWTRARTWPLIRELSILLGFLVLTSAMTWPWVTRLRDAVVDPGDPYLLSWVLWWDFHQTFTNPLHLFDANIFYPLRYTLAFTENDYGISLLFFPLFALGARPLTVNSVATFLGFAFSGYGAFRLTRTLTGSNGAAWVAGIIFAFLPYRFHLMSQVHYVFGGWMPLTFEAVVLFVRSATRKRAAWLATAFTMNGLTCLTWFMLSLVPLALTALFLIVRHDRWRDRDFWIRGAAAAFASLIALLPFLLPYYYVNRAYGFTWAKDVVERGSPTVKHWLLAEQRNKLWKGFGWSAPGGNYALFPGLLPLVLSGVALVLRSPLNLHLSNDKPGKRTKLVLQLDVLAMLFLVLALVATGWAGAPTRPLLRSIFAIVTADGLLFCVFVVAIARLSLAYPAFLIRLSGAPNLVHHIRELKDGEAIWLSGIWIIFGFFMSLGTNSWVYRFLYEYAFIFRGMREPSRAAMVASLGLAVAAGIGADRLASAVSRARYRLSHLVAVLILVFALLFELRAAPLHFMRGAVFPDELTLRLKQTRMRGGIVELPTGGGELPHLYMLRAADHGKPLINAISTFVPEHSATIDAQARISPIPSKLLDDLERVPTSYLVVHFPLIDPSRRPIYQAFLARGMGSGRLRFIRRYGEGDDLYAVVKTEPEAVSEGAIPFSSPIREWAAMVEEDPVRLVTYKEWGRDIYLVQLVAWGELPRRETFMKAAKEIGSHLLTGVDEENQQFLTNLSKYVERLTASEEFRHRYAGLEDEQYVKQLLVNSGQASDPTQTSVWVDGLRQGQKTRSDVLLEIATRDSLREQEKAKALVLLHFFGYLRRNPTDPPDGNINGFLHWVYEVRKNGDENLTTAFASSIEYQQVSGKLK